MTNDELIPTAEVQRLLSLTAASSVSRLVQSGKLEPAAKLPGLRGAFLFRRSDVEQLAKERAA